MSTKDNGGEFCRDEKPALAPPTLTITVSNVSNFQLRIDGTFPSLDYALNMLAQATRELEGQWRIARAQQFQQQQAAAALDESIRRSVMRKA